MEQKALHAQRRAQVERRHGEPRLARAAHLVLAAGQGVAAQAAQHGRVRPLLFRAAHNQAVHAQAAQRGQA
jgi:hypothetical protein